MIDNIIAIMFAVGILTWLSYIRREQGELRIPILWYTAYGLNWLAGLINTLVLIMKVYEYY